MKLTNTKFVTAAALALSLAACGTKTNPTADYQDLRDAGKPQQAQVKPQMEADEICLAPTTSPRSQVLNFNEGAAGQYLFSAHCVLDGVKYNLIAKGLPEGASFGPNPATPDQFILQWTPKKGTVARGKEFRQIEFSLEYQILAYPADQVTLAKGQNGKENPFTIIVSTRAVSPSITSVRVASDSITQGEKVAITIEAQDPVAADGRAPALLVGDDDAGASDTDVIPASSLVKFDPAPKALGDGKYLFSGVLDTASLDWAWKKRGDVTARVLVALQTADGLQSSQVQVNVKIMKKADPAPAPQAPEDKKPAPAPKKKKGGKK